MNDHTVEKVARREAEGRKVCRYGNDCPDVGGPCPACDGTGAQDDGDPEIGQRLTDCDRCKGTGKTAAPPPPAPDELSDAIKLIRTQLLAFYSSQPRDTTADRLKAQAAIDAIEALRARVALAGGKHD